MSKKIKLGDIRDYFVCLGLTDVEQHSHLTRQRANKRSFSKSRSEKSSQTSFSNEKVSKLRKTQRNQMDVDPSHDPPSDSVSIINIIDQEENGA